MAYILVYMFLAGKEKDISWDTLKMYFVKLLLISGGVWKLI